MLIQLKPTICVADAVKIKANSSKNVDRVRRYIENQERHHRKVTFQEEYIRFLKQYGIAYDERYVFG